MNIAEVRDQFPILKQSVYDKPLVYLDSAATTQKPQAVIDALKQAYEKDYANVHRGVHALSMRATEQFEATREAVRAFINAQSSQEIILTKGATESLNLVAQSYGLSQLQTGDIVLLSAMEHHSNIVPWQQVCQQTGASLQVIPLLENGDVDQAAYQQLLSDKVKVIAITQVSNAIGAVNPVAEMIQLARQYASNSMVVIDGTQAVQHIAVDVQALDCDFYVFSSHKMYGPSGVGVLYGKKALLESMPPYQTGGDMISMVTFDKSEFNVLPHKFEAGTPNIADVIAFKAAIDFLQAIGLDVIHAYEKELIDYAIAALRQIDGVTIIAEPKERVSVISFTIANVHAHDVGTIMDQEGVAIRAGHHCAMPLMALFKVPATARISIGIYNNKADIDRAIEAIKQVKKVFGDD